MRTLNRFSGIFKKKIIFLSETGYHQGLEGASERLAGLAEDLLHWVLGFRQVGQIQITYRAFPHLS
jgi:hypothetical protein